MRETVQPALMSKKTNTQNNKNWKEATVTENEDSSHKFTLKGQGKKAADNETPKHDSSATKRTYDEISEAEKETTFTNKTNKGRNAKKNPDVPVHSENIQESSVASVNNNRETDSEVVKAQK